MVAIRITAALVLGAGLALAQATPSSPTGSLQPRTQAAAGPDDAESHFRRGDQLEKSGDLTGAEGEYKKSVQLQAKNPSALGALAYLYFTQQRYPQAEDALRKFIALDPQNPKAHVQLGSVLLASNQNDNAAKEFSAAVGLAPSDPNVLKQVAKLYAAHQMFLQAAQHFSALARLDPKDADGHYGYGVVLMQQRNFPLAQNELQQAVSLQPDLKEAYGDLAVAASENKNYVAAVRALDARSRYLPESAATYFLRATSYDHLKKLPAAAENYKRFLATDGGKNPNQEWQAKHRLVAIDKK
jgi:Flp pilus assembly protein TadD